MDILIDTNILLDFLGQREPFNTEADRLIKKCEEKSVTGYIAAHSIANMFYILRKDYTVEERKSMLYDICELLEVVEIDKPKIVKALTNEGFNDFEDCLQAECAKAVGAAYIVTRDIKDFSGASIPAIMPKAFLQKLEEHTEIHNT